MQVLSTVGNRTISSVMAEHAQLHPQREFLIFEDTMHHITVFTWQQANEIINRIASLLQERGVTHGTKVHMHLVNRPEFIFGWFACARLGAILVPTNTVSSVGELVYIVNHSESAISITEPTFAQQMAEVKADCPLLREILIIDQEPFVEAKHSSTQVNAPQKPVCPLDDAAILYTSGTTAKPKGVLVTHANYIYAGESVAKGMRLVPEDRFLTVLPLFHGNAQYYSTMSVLVTGATLLLMERFSASRYFDQAIKHKATVASLFAAPMRMLLAQPRFSQSRKHKVRLAIFAQNLSELQVQEWEERFAVPLMQIYGMTETMGPPLMNPLDDRRDPHSIGRVILGYTCRIVDGQGNDVATGEAGQLLVGGIPGLSLMRGYFKDESATNAAFQDGWLATGDNVRCDEQGYIYFVDRLKDMIKRAGENIAASEVESVIKEYPGVFDVAVVGVPDTMRDEAIKAYVVLREDSNISDQDIINWCRKRLAKFKVPGEIEFVKELPRTSVGKIQKHLLRSLHTA
jgi:crotonobetaine/carnitine-CoA ligase